MRLRIIGGALALVTLLATSLVAAPAASVTPAAPAPLACPGCWHPALNTSWQWKLSVLPTASEISGNTLGMWDIDGFDNSAATVTGLKAHGKVVCYISAGSYEGWRADAASFPGSASLNSSTQPHAILGILGWNRLAGTSAGSTSARSRRRGARSLPS